MSQADLAPGDPIPASKVVALVDERVGRLVERQSARRSPRGVISPDRSRAPRADGAPACLAEHESELTAALSADERAQLVDLLERVADDVGFARGIHPGVGEHGRPPDGRGASEERG